MYFSILIRVSVGVVFGQSSGHRFDQKIFISCTSMNLCAYLVKIRSKMTCSFQMAAILVILFVSISWSCRAFTFGRVMYLYWGHTHKELCICLKNHTFCTFWIHVHCVFWDHSELIVLVIFMCQIYCQRWQMSSGPYGPIFCC